MVSCGNGACLDVRDVPSTLQQVPFVFFEVGNYLEAPRVSIGRLKFNITEPHQLT